MSYELIALVTVGSSAGDKVEKVLKDSEAMSVKVTKLGKKQLAYPVKKTAEGEYVVFNFEAEGQSIKKINDKLRLEQEALLRYLITSVRKGKVTKGSKPIQAVSEGKEVKEEKKKPKVTVKTVTAKGKTSAAKSTKIKKETKAKKKTTKKGKKK